MGKKITQLATITEVADDDLLVGVDVSDTSGSDNGTNKKFTKASLLQGLAPLDPQRTGWNPFEETLVYHNVDNPTGYVKIEGKDVSADYSPGMRIMFTNGGNLINGIITGIAYSNPNTIITFLHEINPTNSQALHLMVNSAITNPFYSTQKAPQGFPLNPNKWSVTLIDTTERSQDNPANGTYYNLGSLNFSIPIGVWNISYSGLARAQIDTSSTAGVQLGLSTSNNSVSNAGLIGECYANNTIDTGHLIYREALVSQTSKMTWYVISMTRNFSITKISIRNNIITYIATATCAYL